MRNFILSFSFAFLLLSGSFTTCSAATPQKVAILPVLTSAHVALSPEIESIIANGLHKKFHTSLSSIVPVFEILPAATVKEAMTVLQPEKNKLSVNRNMLAAIAEKTSADIVIAAEVTSYRDFSYTRWDGEQIQETNVAIRLASYQRASQNYIEVRDRKSYHGAAMPTAFPDYITDDMMYYLLKKLPNYREG
ncbi:hypothetical protein P22_2445 [Propionispora sp. 2/2-37]|uniref:hypothetical protein n=1 Tax=Propionispora sp. 2/2-37 TaxID=1677858 RepID=UPI0006BB6F32|nr:hypothetical protein [Propionispora sp. 2/2-37]CUH96355.1 hypothetical protein P22_2445 [Propionispora sp. 2/2-37]